MNDLSSGIHIVASEHEDLPQYVTPVVRVMTEAEVLSAFQVTAAGPTAMWWVC